MPPLEELYITPPAGYRLTSVVINKSDISAPVELTQKIDEFGSCDGWACWQSGAQMWIAKPAPNAPALGNIIAAELSSGNRSLHINQKGGGWVTTLYADASQLAEEAAVQFLMDEYSIIATDNKNMLHYHRYWSIEDDGRPVLKHARFCGFGALVSMKEEA